MNGYMNKQNCRIWDDTNPCEIHQLQMHPEKVTVWCGFWSGGIIGPYFFQNEAGVAMIVNGERYRSISNFLWPKMDDMDTNNIWFQQDLTPLDFFLWDYLKSQVYMNKPQTIALKVITNASKFSQMRENH